MQNSKVDFGVDVTYLGFAPWFCIKNQKFYLQVKETEEEAEWFVTQLKKAFVKLEESNGVH